MFFSTLMMISFEINTMDNYTELKLSDPMPDNECHESLNDYQDSIKNGVRTMYICRNFVGKPL